MTEAAHGTFRSRLKAAALIIVLTGVVFVFIEGIASTVLSLYLVLFRPQPGPTEHVHTEYDELLGWINLPDFYDPDMYGEGIYLQTNSQRFRNTTDFTTAVPDGKKRVICSGDSYTLAWGVTNEQAWCAVLGRLRPNLETVNMGQGGYGVDQAYLWYMRDGTVLDHDLHIFALITPDIHRMKSDRFIGFGKPVLRPVGDRIEVENVPVPRPGFRFAWLDRRRYMLDRFRIVELTQAVLGRLIGGQTPRRSPTLTNEEVRAVLSLMLAELKRTNDEKGSVLAVVHLPRSGDQESRESDPWRAFLQDEAERIDFVFVDLVKEFRELPLSTEERFFQIPYFPSHYTVEGNEWVAQQLQEKLLPLLPQRGETERLRTENSADG